MGIRNQKREKWEDRRKTEDRRPRTEDRGPKTEDGREKREDRRRKTEDGREKTEDGREKTEDRRPMAEDGRLKTEDRRPKTEGERPKNSDSKTSSYELRAGGILPACSPHSPSSFELRASSFIILRHDVDLLPKNSLAFARIQHEMGIRGSYYFRAVPESWDEAIIKEIHALGHEVGYHYEDVDLVKSEKIKDKSAKCKIEDRRQ